MQTNINTNNYNYNPYRIPYNKTISEQHRSATSAGQAIQDDTQLNKLCACCFMPVKRRELRINFGMEELKGLGYEYGWLYQIGKIMGVVLGFVLFDSGLGQFQDVFVSGGSSGGLFGRNWSSLAAGYPVQKLWLYSTLSFVSLVFLLLLIKLYQTHRSNTLKHTSPTNHQQNYSILLKNIPKTTNPQQKIQDLFKTNFHNLYIKQILLIPIMQIYIQLKSDIDREVGKWRQLLKNQSKKKQEILEVLKKIDECNRKFVAYKLELNRKKEQNFSGNAIVVFESTQNQTEILKAWKSKFFTKNKLQASFGQFVLGDKQSIIFEEAPSPTQINWQNISLSNSQQNGRRRFSYLLIGLCQVVFFVVYFCGQLVFGRRVGVVGGSGEDGRSVCTLVFISILSYTLLPYIIEKIQKRQKSPTQTHSYIQKTYKLTVSLTIFRSFTILAAESVFTKSSQLTNSTLNKILILTLCDISITTILQLLNFTQLPNLLLKHLQNNKNNLTQHQANNLYKKPSHNIPLKYSILLSSFIIAIMYSNLMPVVIVIQVVGIFGFYWIDKVNLVRRNSVQFGRISVRFMEEGVNIMQLALIAKPILNLIYISISKQSLPIHQIIMFILSICYYLTPKQPLITKILQTLKYQPKQIDPNPIYNQSQLQTLYKIQSPITSNYTIKLQYIQTKYGNNKLRINNQSAMIQEIDITDTIQDKIVSKISNQVVEDVDVNRRGDYGGYETGRRISQFNQEEENDGNV